MSLFVFGVCSFCSLFLCALYFTHHLCFSKFAIRLLTQNVKKYRGIHKSLRDFRPLRYSSRDGHAEGEHINRGRDTPSLCPTLQVLGMSILGDAADVNPVTKFLPHVQELDYRIDISRITKGGHTEKL